jgi:hypothetical protein
MEILFSCKTIMGLHLKGTLREGKGEFENRVLRRIFRPERKELK